MKKTKRNISIVLIFAILFALMPKQVYAIKKVRLNKSKLSLYVGKKYTLKVKNTNKKVKWSSTKKKIATVTKKGKVIAKKKGNCNIIAKVGRKKYACKIIVKNKKAILHKESNHSSTVKSSTPASLVPTSTPIATALPTVPPKTTTQPQKTLIYDYSQEAPSICNYDEFKYNSFRVWLCPFIFYGEKLYKTKDYRGKKLHYELSIKNSGNRNLPVIDINLNCTSPIVYPIIFRVVDPAYKDFDKPIAPDPADYLSGEADWTYEDALEDYENALKEYNQRKTVTLEQPINKGQIYTYSFDYTIPSFSVNEDVDRSNDCRYPILLYISNQKAYGVYESGDEITILGLKIYEVDDF